MHPFQFGNPNKLLYGTYATSSSRTRETCILLCPPIAYEYQQSWWAYKQLANRLSKLGFPTLKFDYFATGNSFGETHEGSVAQWLDDINSAAQVLLERSGKKKIAIIGLRFGATLASIAMKKINPSDIILWDPVIFGEHYLGELNSLHQQKLKSMGHPATPPQNEYHGYIFSDSLLAEIQAINLTEPQSWVNNPTQITLLSSKQNKSHQNLIAHLKENGHSLDNKPLEDINDWKDLKTMESFILPSKTIKTICDIFTESP